MPEFQFDGLRDFLSMGGDAFFVWSAYAVFVVGVAWNLIQPRLARRKVMELLKARMQREGWASRHPETEERT